MYTRYIPLTTTTTSIPEWGAETLKQISTFSATKDSYERSPVLRAIRFTPEGKDARYPLDSKLGYEDVVSIVCPKNRTDVLLLCIVGK
jgi:hypothetical protein